jgi:hypothetical protein
MTLMDLLMQLGNPSAGATPPYVPGPAQPPSVFANAPFPVPSAQPSPITTPPRQNKRSTPTAPIETAVPDYIKEEKEDGFFSRLGSGVSDYLSDPVNRKQLALGFNAMRLNPDAGMARSLTSQIERIQDTRMLNAAGNRTADALEAMGETKAAALIRSNPAMAKEVYAAVIAQRGKVSPYAKKGMELRVENDINLVQTAEMAQQGLLKLDETLDLLEQGQAATGLTSQLVLQFNRLKTALLPEGSKAAEVSQEVVSDTQLLESLLGSDVFPQIKALGIGARGLDTPAERQFLLKVMTGEASMDKDTLIRMTMLRRKYLEQTITSYNDKLASGGLDQANRDVYEGRLTPIQYINYSISPDGVSQTTWDKMTLSQKKGYYAQ